MTACSWLRRLRVALKGLSRGEKWWPTLQARGLCWCGFHSAEDRDHGPRCKRAAEALGQMPHREVLK